MTVNIGITEVLRGVNQNDRIEKNIKKHSARRYFINLKKNHPKIYRLKGQVELQEKLTQLYILGIF